MVGEIHFQQGIQRRGELHLAQHLGNFLLGQLRHVGNGQFQVPNARGRVGVVHQRAHQLLIVLDYRRHLGIKPERQRKGNQASARIEHRGNKPPVNTKEHAQANQADDYIVHHIHLRPETSFRIRDTVTLLGKRTPDGISCQAKKKT